MKSPIEVLLVEDSLLDAQIVAAIFNSSSLEKPKLTHTKRFTDALTMLAEQAYDLVLLDLHLPDGEGINLIKQLKQQVPETPIVVLTGLQDEDIAALALEEGAQDYVIKSETLSPERLSKLGHTDVGNWLVRRIHYAIQRKQLIQKLETDLEGSALTHIGSQETGSQESIWDWDLKNNCVYLSPQWSTLLGMHNNDINHHPDDWLSRIHPDDRPQFERALQDHLTHRHGEFYCEYRIRHANGDYFWVLTVGQALWDNAGVAYRIAGSQSDITERRTQEKSAYEKREMAQTTLYAIGAGLLSLQGQLCLSADLDDEAEPLLKAALHMRQALLGHNHLEVGTSFYNLATLYDNQFRFQEAETLYKKSLAIFQNSLGSNHPHTKRIQAKVGILCRLNQVMKGHQDQDI